MHIMKRFIDIRKIPVMSNILIDFEISIQISYDTHQSYNKLISLNVTFYQSRYFSPALDSSKGSSSPGSSSNL
jgi:hypothetical protein